MKIYLDMDGVIADFFGGLQKYYGVDHWKNLPDKEESIWALKYTNFFDTLDPFPTSARLVNTVRELAGDNYGICSSPLRGDKDNSAYWKRVWLTRHNFLPSRVPNIIFTGYKPKYAIEDITGGPNILVDDKPSNVDSWKAKGGIGIRYQANEDSVDDLIDQLKTLYVGD